MKCDRRWWLDGRRALVDRTLFPTQPGGQFCVPQTSYLAVFEVPGKPVVWELCTACGVMYTKSGTCRQCQRT